MPMPPDSIMVLIMIGTILLIGIYADWKNGN
jgi:hypothetical protein